MVMCEDLTTALEYVRKEVVGALVNVSYALRLLEYHVDVKSTHLIDVIEYIDSAIESLQSCKKILEKYNKARPKE
jgi:hypothetical protein